MPKLFSIYTKIPFQFMRCRKSSTYTPYILLRARTHAREENPIVFAT